MKANIILLLILILQLPTFFVGAIYMVIPILVALFFAFRYSISKNNRLFKDIIFSNKIIWLFVTVLIFSILRTNNVDYTMSFLLTRVIGFVSLIIGVFSLITYLIKRFPAHLLVLNLILIPFFLWAVVNFLLWFLDINIRESVLGDNEEAEGVLLSLIGINTGRVQFPLAGGLNNYATILGALLTLTLTYIFILKKKRALNIGIACFIGVSILLIDSRAAIIVPLLILAFLYLLFNKKQINFLKWAPLLVVVGPPIIMLVLPIIAQTDLVSSLSRSSGDIATGNSRFLIWGIAYTSFLNFTPMHLIGFGEFGHFGSGTSKLWAFLFNSWENSEMKSPHNSMLSILFDMGYLGLLIYLLLIFQFFQRIISTWTIRRESCILYTGFMLYNIIAGFTETITGFYSPNFLVMFFLILICEYSEYRFVNKKLNLIN